MDHELAELKRLRDADPADAEAAQRYEAALLRAGQREEVQRLYTFKFQCQENWHFMAETDDPNRRDCSVCQKSVHVVTTQDEVAARIQEGACVAFDPRSVDALAFLIEDGSVTSAQGEKETCLVDNSVIHPYAAGGPRHIQEHEPIPSPLDGVLMPFPGAGAAEIAV